MSIVNGMNQRNKQVDSHVAAGDYFGTLATILSLLSENQGNLAQNQANKILKDLVEDLVYLQRQYKITRIK